MPPTTPPHHPLCAKYTKIWKKQKTKKFIKICQVRKNEDLTSDWKKYKNKNVSKVRKTFLHSWMKKIHQVFLKHSEGLITAAVLQNKTRKTKNKTPKKQEEVVFSRNNRSVQEVIDRPPGQGRKNVSIKKQKKQNRKSSLYLQRGAWTALCTLPWRHVTSSQPGQFYSLTLSNF